MLEKIKAFLKNIWQKILYFPRFMKEAFLSWWNDICPKKEKTSKTENANYQYGNNQNSWNASGTENNYYQNANTSYNNTAGNAQSTEKEAKTQKALSPLAHIFDVVASLCFLFALVIALKPELLQSLATKNFLSHVKPATLLYEINLLEFVKQIEKEILSWRNLFVTIGIVFFALFKLVTIFKSKAPIKIVPILLLALSLLTCFIVKYHLILFLVFIILLYLAFEFSCSFNWKTIWRKSIIISILFLAEYFVIHFIMIEGLLKQFAIHGICW